MIGWPATLEHGPVGLRPLRRGDAAHWVDVRRRNQSWLERWEGSTPGTSTLNWRQRHGTDVFQAMRRAQARDAKAGRSLPFAVTYQGRLVGQVTLSTIVRGAFDNGSIGYWVDQEVAGRNVIPTAVALVTDHAMRMVGLHRIEINIRPENTPSIRVVEKLGFRLEGRHERFLFIDGGWRDHLSYALTREELPLGLLRRWETTRDTPQHLHEE